MPPLVDVRGESILVSWVQCSVQVSRMHLESASVLEAKSPAKIKTSRSSARGLANLVPSQPSSPSSSSRSASPLDQSKWSGWRNLAGQQQILQCARLSQLYGAVYRHYMLSGPFESLKSGSRVLISWMWEASASSGIADIQFKSASEVAVALTELRKGTLDDHRSNEGGLLQLVGSPDLFWSSIIHWHMHGTCMPIGYSELQFKVPRPPCDKPLTEKERLAGPRLRRIKEGLFRNKSDAPASSTQSETSSERPRNSAPDLPAGWQEARRDWDKALERASRIGKIVNCMFYCTPMGCAAEDACPLQHNEKRRSWCISNAAAERGLRNPSAKKPPTEPPPLERAHSAPLRKVWSELRIQV